MEDTFVYITQDREGSYNVRSRDSPEKYLKDLEAGKKLGYNLIKSFRVPFKTLGNVLSECGEFDKKKISLSELEKRIYSLIQNAKLKLN